MATLVRKSTALTLALTSLLFLPGCGVIFGGSSETIALGSSPDHANVAFKRSGRTMVTPTEVSLERKGEYVLTFSREGYEPRQAEISRHLRGGILALDILFTGLIGVVVDAATGGWYSLKPERVDVALTKADTAAVGPETLHVRMEPVSVTKDTETVEIRSDLPVGVSIRRKP
ncbi:MAG TPA: hypothetical protein VJ997_13590 [Longimicrobiales bacterium]|nr:hypothetical protein [Longimicrobiales bacterium]